MAYASATFGYQQPQTDSALDNKRAPFIDDVDDDSAVLDPSILDADIMQSPSNTTFRKDSFAHSNAVISPADSQPPWDHHYSGGLSAEPVSAGASNPFHEDGNDFMRQSNQHPQAFVHHHPQHAAAWPFEHGSGSCTPTTGAEFMPPPPHFEASQYSRTDSAHGSFSQPPPHQQFNVPQSEAGFILAPQVQTPMSPHSHQDWMGMAQQEMEGRPAQKRMRAESPQRSFVDFQRRDGIRKKNGRIDIPQERNIQTIDDLIEKTTDDELLKELKQQKRLLRNREAALASRQRKKKHTEDLEMKEKNYAHTIASLEQKVHELTIQHEHRDRERQVVISRLEEAHRVIETLEDEKRNIIMRHNDESSGLRKKIQILTDQLDAGPAPSMSAVPSSTGFTDFNAEMEALNMGPHDWDSFILAGDMHHSSHDDFGFEPRPEPIKPSPMLEKKASSTTVTPSPKKHNDATSEQPIASGLLFMLLLCGAFVASKPASSQPSDLPDMPQEVRNAAPTVLNNLLSDSNPGQTHDHAHAMVMMRQEPLASGITYNDAKPSRIDRMHRALTTPTKQQEIDQVFGLTPAQYASISGMDLPAYDQPPPPSQSESAPPQRRNLAEALANLEHQHPRNSKAEVYTRSLLWDQIPADVVRQFKDIVRDNNEIEARQQHQRRPSHEYPYKIEP